MYISMKTCFRVFIDDEGSPLVNHQSLLHTMSLLADVYKRQVDRSALGRDVYKMYVQESPEQPDLKHPPR